MNEEKKTLRISQWITPDNKTINIDYDKLLRSFDGKRLTFVMNELSDYKFWAIALPWMDVGETIKSNFAEKFQDPKAIIERKSAVWGNNKVKKERELILLRWAYTLSEMEDKNGELYKNNIAGLGQEMMEIMTTDGGHKTLEILAEMHKDGFVEKGVAGGLESNKGQMLAAFVICFMKDTARLPTKKEVRDLAGILPDTAEANQANKYLAALGLGGLRPS